MVGSAIVRYRQLLAYLVVVAAMVFTVVYSVEKSTSQDNKIARIAAAENRDRALATQLVCASGNLTKNAVRKNSTQLGRPIKLPNADCAIAVQKVNTSSK